LYMHAVTLASVEIVFVLKESEIKATVYLIASCNHNTHVTLAYNKK